MTGLVGFKGVLYSFNSGGKNGALDLRDKPFSGAEDLGNPDRTSWEKATRTYLSAHPEVTVVMWSWCGQVSSATEADITRYCSLMDGLERDFPGVSFVYMTGHLDGTGLTGKLHLRNEQIRRFCRENNKILYDFADIESYNPDGVWFGDKMPNDACAYDTNGDGSRDGNWALEWQAAHPGEWYACSSAHSQPLNANRKAYAAWWLFARLAGWSSTGVAAEVNAERLPLFELRGNYPNPFNASTLITVVLHEPANAEIGVYDTLGRRVTTLSKGFLSPGTHAIRWNGADDSGRTVASGAYFCRVAIPGKGAASRRMLYLR
jgi:hypothetical protein